MPHEMVGRRIPIADPTANPYFLLKEAGDYCGPSTAFSNGNPSIWFLLPIARDKDVHGPGRAIHHVEMPPHTYREEPDGTLTIRESIGAGLPGQYYWHGYLTDGKWELLKSKP